MNPSVALEAASGAQLLPQRVGPEPSVLNPWIAYAACSADLRARSEPHRAAAASITITNRLTDHDRTVLARLDVAPEDLTNHPTTTAHRAEEGMSR